MRFFSKCCVRGTYRKAALNTVVRFAWSQMPIVNGRVLTYPSTATFREESSVRARERTGPQVHGRASAGMATPGAPSKRLRAGVEPNASVIHSGMPSLTLRVSSFGRLALSKSKRQPMSLWLSNRSNVHVTARICRRCPGVVSNRLFLPGWRLRRKYANAAVGAMRRTGVGLAREDFAGGSWVSRLKMPPSRFHFILGHDTLPALGCSVACCRSGAVNA